MVKTQPIEVSTIDGGQIELAHIFIRSVADQFKVFGVTFTEDESGDLASDRHDQYGKLKEHSHFVLYDHQGNGKYIRRDRYGKTVEIRVCTVWDLGFEFANKVSDGLGELM